MICGKPFWHWYTFVNVAVIIFCGAIFGYWYFIDGVYLGKVIDISIDTQNYPTSKEVYRKGEMVKLLTSFCKYREIPATTYWTLVDGAEVSLGKTESSAKIGCYGKEKPFYYTAAKIPDGIELSGKWRLKGMIYWHINPIKDLVLPIQSQEFTIE